MSVQSDLVPYSTTNEINCGNAAEFTFKIVQGGFDRGERSTYVLSSHIGGSPAKLPDAIDVAWVLPYDQGAEIPD
jgi:hypothetical protein